MPQLSRMIVTFCACFSQAAVVAFWAAIRRYDAPSTTIAARATSVSFFMMAPEMDAAILSDNRLGFDFDEHRGIDQLRDLDHRRRGPYTAERLAVRASDLFPVRRDVHDVHTRSDDVGERGTRLCERRFDVSKRLLRLRIRVTRPDDAAGLVRRCGSGNVDVAADADRARIADNRFPFRAVRDVLPVHGPSVSRASISLLCAP